MDKEGSDSWMALARQLYEASSGGDSLEPPDSDHLGALVRHFEHTPDRYELGEFLGRGGWKEVCLAFDKHCGREVAFARPSDPGSSEIVEAFFREARIIASLEHPGIISLYSLGITEEGVPFYAMEKQLGGSLRNALKHRQINVEQAMEVFQQICHAIAYAHLVGVVHLDLKPENIQIGAHGVVKVCDWGLSAAIRRPITEPKGATGFYDLCGDNGDFSRTAGTPGYLAPERKTTRAAATPAADIFALGVILKEISAIFPRGSRRRLAAIAARASAESPEARYESVGELQTDLKRYLSQLPTSVEPGGVFARIGLFVRRYQRGVAYAASSCALIAVLSALALVHNQRTQRQINRALASEVEAHELQVLAEMEAQDIQTKRLTEAYEQSSTLHDLVIIAPSLSKQVISESITLLTEAITSSTDDETTRLARAQLGTAYFIAQRFNEALEAFSGTDLHNDLEEIAARFADHPRKDGVLAKEGYIKLLKAIPPERILLQQKMVFYDRSIREDWNAEVEIALAWLENKNPSWSARKSRWSDINKSLVINGKRLESFTETPEMFQRFHKNILVGLEIEILRLEKTGFRSYGQLSGLNISTLDLSRENYPSVKNLGVLGDDIKVILPKRSKNSKISR